MFEIFFCKHRIAIWLGCFWINNDTNGWRFRFPRLLRYIESVQGIFFSSSNFFPHSRFLTYEVCIYFIRSGIDIFYWVMKINMRMLSVEQ